MRLLSIPQSPSDDVPNDESRELRGMVGEIFEVQEIDEYGTAWIERWWQDGDGESHGHNLGLAPDEMELVGDSPS